ncbi:methyl-accepting chemotaxis protein [Desulfovibrio sp. TomC]|uniref:methyl-accepting chemotaxis protein n=1 Tax=Desulfovibrio sp. TomC TaxID=1562888 RepID=UPI0005752CE4|nr:methyl-accepting chemotaxis protein [Desulfovibrio sp. TomC]KHK02607.1 Methyl-accepting chemotaxis protein [Desulfovibrio sp. TomC]
MQLKAKFIIPTLLLIICGMSLTTWLTYTRSTDTLSALSVEKAKTNLSALLSMVDIWIDGAQNEVITLAKTDDVSEALSNGDAASKAHALSLAKDVLGRHPTFDNILVIDAKGIVATATNPVLVGVDASDREYVKKTLTGQNFISNPLVNKDIGKVVFVIAAPIQRDGKTIGVIAAGIQIERFTEQFVAPLDSPAGNAFVTTADGLTLAHPDRSLVGKFNLLTDTDFGRQMAGQSSGMLDVMSLGKAKLILFEKSKRTGWLLGMSVNKDVAFAGARSLGLHIVWLSAGVALFLAAGVWFILSVNVLRPVGALVAAAKRIAAGNLDTPLNADRRDEIGSLQQAMAAMVVNLKAKIGEAEEQSARAAEETEKAKTAMEEAEAARSQAESAREQGMLQAAATLEGIVAAVSDASEAIATQIDHVSHGSRDQSHRVGETATAMEEMNATVLEVAQNASKAAQTADTARHKANAGSDIVTRVIASIAEVQKRAEGLKVDMTALGQQAEGIGHILGVISDIADQTNLLALNAAIEAARAGEAGRGFAVVADEVRKLAEKTMTATKEVGQAIGDIQQGTRKNIDNVELAAGKINDATALAEDSGQTLGAIVALVDATTDQVRSIATAAEEQSATTEEINRSIVDINRLAEASATALEQSTQSVSELAKQTQMLRGLIDEMQGGGSGSKRLPAGSRRPALPAARR